MNTLLIKTKMISRGLTQEDLARACRLERKAIQRILSGEVKKPHKSTIKAISEYLGVSPLELIEDRTEISRRKLLKFLLIKTGNYGFCDYYIFRNQELNVTDIKVLVNNFNINLDEIALGPEEPESLKFDGSKLFRYIVNSQADIAKAYEYKERALEKMSFFRSYAKDILKCKLMEAYKLLDDGSVAEDLYLYTNKINYYVLTRGILDLNRLNEKDYTDLEGVPDDYLKCMQGRPLGGEFDAKVIRTLAELYNTNANAFLCPRSLM